MTIKSFLTHPIRSFVMHDQSVVDKVETVRLCLVGMFDHIVHCNIDIIRKYIQILYIENKIKN